MTQPMPTEASMSGLAFHHVGVACKSITSEAGIFAALGYSAESKSFEDPVQGIRGQFLTGPGPRLELLEPLGASTVLDPYLRRGTKMYHLAFQASSIDLEISRLVKLGGRVVSDPVAAIAFDGRLVCFIMLKNFQLIELIEGE
jgi:methylmalonyl-CoA/ethylmalonyl-CoA epimerase